MVPLRRPLFSGRHLVVLCCAVVVALVCGTAVRAHELGTTRVSVLLHADGTYSVEILTDAASLVEKLAASSGAPFDADARADRLQALLTGFDATFRRRVALAFDASDVRPAISYAVTPGADGASAPLATIRMTGPVPPGAGHVTWSFGWTFASYAVTVAHEAGGDPTTAWLEGGQVSPWFAVPSAAPPVTRIDIAWQYLVLGFTHIVPKGLDHMLFVLGIYLLSTRARSVLWQVSAFTLAHSITLGLSMYGIVSVSPGSSSP